MINIGDLIFKISNAKLAFMIKRETIFPYYHLIGKNNKAHIKYLYPIKSEKQFIEDLDFLLKNYTPLNPKDLLQNKTIKNGFLLSFDDGLKEVYTKIYPILKERNLSAIFFINPDFVDNKDALYRHFLSISYHTLEINGFQKIQLDTLGKLLDFKYESIEEFKKKFFGLNYFKRNKVEAILDYLKIDKKEYLKNNELYITSNEIKEMINDGFYIGGHTMSHPPLKLLSIDEQEREIVHSINWVKEHFDLNYSFFAFPFSDESLSKELVKRLVSKYNKIKIFGNSGIKKDIHPSIIQRFTLEDPNISAGKEIVFENLLKLYRKLRSKNEIVRR
jgi:peptidoglycan/xylan/chitin deacetylase (PgdA/CDA1 family)